LVSWDGSLVCCNGTMVCCDGSSVLVIVVSAISNLFDLNSIVIFFNFSLLTKQ